MFGIPNIIIHITKPTITSEFSVFNLQDKLSRALHPLSFFDDPTTPAQEMHFKAQLLAALAAVHLASSAPLLKPGRRQLVGSLFDVTEGFGTAADQILQHVSTEELPVNVNAAQLTDFLSKVVDATEPTTEGLADTVTAVGNAVGEVAEDSFDYLFGGATGEKKKRGASSPKRRRQIVGNILEVTQPVLTSGGRLLEDIAEQAAENNANIASIIGVADGPVRDIIGEATELVADTATNVGNAVDEVAADSFEALFGGFTGEPDKKKRGVEGNANKNKPRQWEWLPPDRYVDEIVDVVDDTVSNVGQGLDYLLDWGEKM
ncbi:hypothetical protein V8F20_010127 [Naviculisporaceae sp. PSN 640]